MTHRPRRTLLTAALVGGVLLGAACGDDDEAPAPATEPEGSMMTQDSMMTEDSMMMTDTTAAS